MIHVITRTAMALSVLLVSTSIFANVTDKSAVQLKKASTPALFSEQADRVRKDIAEGNRYGKLSVRDKKDVLDRLDRMHDLLQEHGDTGNMNDRDRIVLFNDQEAVNGILLRNDQERVVCSMERRTGSKMTSKICRTVGDMAADRTKGREAVEELRSRPTQEDGRLRDAPRGMTQF